jgi:hypothetical protein
VEEIVRRKLKHGEKLTQKQILAVLFPNFSKLCEEHRVNKLATLAAPEESANSDDEYGKYASLAAVLRA